MMVFLVCYLACLRFLFQLRLVSSRQTNAVIGRTAAISWDYVPLVKHEISLQPKLVEVFDVEQIFGLWLSSSLNRLGFDWSINMTLTPL